LSKREIELQSFDPEAHISVEKGSSVLQIAVEHDEHKTQCFTNQTFYKYRSVFL